MKYNNKRLAHFSKFIHYSIALAMCGFLIALSSVIMRDADQLKDYPLLMDHQNESLLNDQELLKDSIDLIIEELLDEEKRFDIQLAVAEQNHEAAKESFDNWLAARGTIGSSDQDQAVLDRANELDQFATEEQGIKVSIDSVHQLAATQAVQKEVFQDLINLEEVRADKAWVKAINHYYLNIFLIRLAIVLPILLIGIFFALKFRKHKYWPLFLGFVLFSVYAFFVGLVPYLPSYGGYIRYTVGIAICLLFGIYAINKIRSFIERKREEMKVSQKERATNVQIESAEKALEDCMCPSCGKGFLIRSWKKTSGKDGNISRIIKNTNFCRFCGLVLFQDCNSCETENFSHLPFCSNCGDDIKAGEIRNEPPLDGT